MKEKLLTIAVPAYNAENHLSACLNSFLLSKALPYLDIVVVNDGSTDRTSAIAHRYALKYPGAIRVIDKANAGHGSGINVAAAAALGKYFKVVDADDRVTTENLPSLLQTLYETDADIILTHYQTVNIKSGALRLYRVGGIDYDILYARDALFDYLDKLAPCFVIHAVLYKTAFYKATNLQMTEHIFYEDTEYSVFPFAYAGSVMALDLLFYRYQIGDVNQSVSIQNYAKRVHHLETVYRNMITHFQSHYDTSETVREFLRIRLVRLLGTYQKVLLLYCPERKQSRQAAKKAFTLLSGTDPVAAKQAQNRYALLRVLHALRIPAVLIEKLYALR